VAILCFADSCEAISIFGDYQEVKWGYWKRIPEGHAQIIFVQHLCWNFAFNNPVKDRDFL
jgi:hypothetical protein